MQSTRNQIKAKSAKYQAAMKQLRYVVNSSKACRKDSLAKKVNADPWGMMYKTVTQSFGPTVNKINS